MPSFGLLGKVQRRWTGVIKDLFHPFLTYMFHLNVSKYWAFYYHE
jgi:hypothetical protein